MAVEDVLATNGRQTITPAVLSWLLFECYMDIVTQLACLIVCRRDRKLDNPLVSYSSTGSSSHKNLSYSKSALH